MQHTADAPRLSAFGGLAMSCETCDADDAMEIADPYAVGMGADPDDPELQGWWCADCYGRRQDDI